MLGTDEQKLSRSRKRQILTVILQICKISAVKHFTEKPKLLYFVDLSTIICPWLKKAMIRSFFTNITVENIYFSDHDAFKNCN